nr:4,5-DOPA dioxygenase extradiol [Corynebacterium lactis]
MPAAFIGHGTPMNTLESNRFTQAWADFGKAVPTPRGILAVSAHWYANATMVTAMPNPRTIHDFYGFPKELNEFNYPAPGLPDLAHEVAEVIKPDWVGMDQDGWGIDHGTWSVLAHVFPKADIPVVQLSINAFKGMDYHMELAAKLNELRRRGILILGSGNVVHNLRAIDFSKPDAAYDWAQRFDEKAQELMLSNPGDVLALTKQREFGMSVPTPDHFIPLLYLAALADAEGQKPEPFAVGYQGGSVSMTSYALAGE